MNNIYEFPRQNERYDDASQWIAKMDKTLSAADQKALQEWMAADKENRAVLLEMAKLWDKMAVMSRLSDLMLGAASHSARLPRIALASAAPVLIIVLAAFGP